MIPGLRGDLISHAYLEELLDANASSRSTDAAPGFAQWWRAVARALGPASSARAVFDVAVVPLLEMLHHDPPAVVPEPYGLRGHVRSSHAALLVVPWAHSPAASWRDAIRSGLASGAEWAIVTNGRSVRMVDCSRAWTRAAIEFDFEHLFLTPRGVAALTMLADRAAMAGPEPQSLRARVNASDAYASRVCESLSEGVLASLPLLARSLAPGRGNTAAAFDQSLTLVYRILFLLFAEARALVPVWHEVYRNAYTIQALTERAARPAPRGLWAGLQAISRLAHAGCRAGSLDVTAFNGRLFSPRHAPLMERRNVPDEVVREVLLSLATRATPQGRRRISYHDLGVEQLGSVYERVLEYEPGRGKGTSLSRTSTRRKSTGSFYTPRALTEFLVRQTLTPLVEGRSADRILELRIVDPAMGSGAFLVAACRFLSECCEQALLRDGTWLDADVTPASRATLRRNVAERCLYGVDLNPTAVQLARVSLWLTTLAADRPLTFLDHHLATGNSLIGARLADLSRPVLSKRAATPASLPLFDDQIAGHVADRVLPARFQLAMQPSDSLEIVRGKERVLAQINDADAALAQWIRAADAWCAARLWSARPAPSNGLVHEWIAASIGAPTMMADARLRESLASARALAAAHGAFHWELAFPEVFFDRDGRPKAGGGFDAVIGNPPWDMVRADTGSETERSGSRSSTTALVRFCRVSQTYRHQGTGHPNSYQLFIERAAQLTRPGGRIGLIVPSGIATDHGSASLRRYLFDQTQIDTWLGFDNRARIFPIHRSMRFVVLAATNAGRTDTLRFRCGLTGVDALEGDSATAPALAIARSRLEAWSPELLTIPELPDAIALGIVAGIGERVPALSGPAGWNARFGRELNATDDRPHFARLSTAGDPLLPVVEGKQIAPFRVDLERSVFGVPRATAARLVDTATTFARERIAYRDVASATNKLTLIAAMLPRGTISTHTLFCLKTALDARAQWCLLALMNSFVANYLVRLQVTTHVTTALMSRLPIPRPRDDGDDFRRLAALAKQIATTTELDLDAYASINAIAARLYGVTVDEYAHILKTFPLIDEEMRTLALAVYKQDTEARSNGGNGPNAG